MNEKMLLLKGKKINTLICGNANTNVVLLSGSGVPFPKYEYMAFMNALSDYYRVILIEKFGYGFSDITDEDRRMDIVIEEYRSALQQLNIQTPVILIGHSMGFIEALRWAQIYPSEVSGFVGLDAAVPGCYLDFDIEKAIKGLQSMANDMQTREAYAEVVLQQMRKEFELSDEETNRCKALLVNNLANKVWINEAENLRESVALVQQQELPQKPTLFFISNGEGTSLSTDIWRKHPLNYLEKITVNDYVVFDHPHTLNKFVPQEMAEKAYDFFSKV